MKLILAAFLLLAPAATAPAQEEIELRDEMRRVDVHTARMLRSTAVEETIAWTQDSRNIAVKVAGKWLQIWAHLKLTRSSWHKNRIGEPDEIQGGMQLDEVQVKSFERWQRRGERLLRLGSSEAFELQRQAGGTRLLYHGKDGTTKELWRTEKEDCRGLAASRDNRYVAYICETAVLITSVDQAAAAKASQPL